MEAGRKLWGKEFVFLLAVGFLNFSAFGMVNPLIPGFVIGLGASLSVAGVVTGMFSFVALAGRPFGSIMGDRLNKKRLLMVSLTLSGVATVFYALAPSVALVVPIRIIHGLLFSISGTLSFALGADYIPKERMGEGVGFLGIGQILGMAVGPNVGIFLLERFSYQFCFAVGGIAIAAAGISVLALRYKPAPVSVKKGVKLSDLVALELMPNALFAAVFMLGNGLIISFLLLLGNERGIEGIGLYFVVNAAVVLIARPLIGRMTDKKGVAYAILPGFLLTSAAMVLIGFGSSLLPIALAGVFFAAGAGSSMPAIQADCFMRLDKSRRAVASGTYFIGLDIGMTVGPILGGIAADAYGFGAAFYGGAALMALGFITYLLRRWRTESRKQRAESRRQKRRERGTF